MHGRLRQINAQLQITDKLILALTELGKDNDKCKITGEKNPSYCTWTG